MLGQALSRAYVDFRHQGMTFRTSDQFSKNTSFRETGGKLGIEIDPFTAFCTFIRIMLHHFTPPHPSNSITYHIPGILQEYSSTNEWWDISNGIEFAGLVEEEKTASIRNAWKNSLGKPDMERVDAFRNDSLYLFEEELQQCQ
jgi:hypothetical protein